MPKGGVGQFMLTHSYSQWQRIIKKGVAWKRVGLGSQREGGTLLSFTHISAAIVVILCVIRAGLLPPAPTDYDFIRPHNTLDSDGT